ncbi:MAG: helix-turn-helix transcriptional regulator [Prevotellaceae bacterium]|jgi:AraC-like DNA-binding protein|nr:helix-turn-helix transcriptional regulator [Prevotellaceae bacterium]
MTYRKYSKGQHFPAEKMTRNCMLFLLKGEMLLNSSEYPGTVLKANQVVLLAIGSKTELLALTDVEYFTYSFTELPKICQEQFKEVISKGEEPATYTPLTINRNLKEVIHQIKRHLEGGCEPDEEYLELKAKELAYFIITHYPITQVGAFFYPISSYTEGFHYFVMQNYDKVRNVEEFAHMGGYTTTTFRRLFKNMYGIPVYEWILDRKREGILNDLRTTQQRISTISARYGFESLSHFAHFCKDSFGDTPRSLRKRAAVGEKIVIIKPLRQNRRPRTAEL